MLLVVSGALEKNDMRHVLCSKPSDFRGSNSKIEEFKHKHNINICVMPLSLGAEGLDLIAANNIFLLEPLLNPALETQALNRANRLGQTRITRVFKYITKDTVEEKILAFSENKKAGSDSWQWDTSGHNEASPSKVILNAKEQERVDETTLRALLM